jgi:hypothetical protein
VLPPQTPMKRVSVLRGADQLVPFQWLMPT